MNDVGAGADERIPPTDEATRDLEAERKGLDPRGKADRAQFRRETVFKLARQIAGVEGQQRASVGATFVPDDARLATRKRQESEWTGRQEMLLGAAFVIAFVRD